MTTQHQFNYHLAIRTTQLMALVLMLIASKFLEDFSTLGHVSGQGIGALIQKWSVIIVPYIFFDPVRLFRSVTGSVLAIPFIMVGLYCGYHFQLHVDYQSPVGLNVDTIMAALVPLMIAMTWNALVVSPLSDRWFPPFVEVPLVGAQTMMSRWNSEQVLAAKLAAPKLDE